MAAKPRIEVVSMPSQHKCSRTLLGVAFVVAIIAVLYGASQLHKAPGGRVDIPSTTHTASSRAEEEFEAAKPATAEIPSTANAVSPQEELPENMHLALEDTYAEEYTIGQLSDTTYQYASYLLPEGETVFTNAQRPMGGKFRSFWPEQLIRFWDDGSPTGVYNGHMPPMGFTATATYTTHTFVFKSPGGEEVARLTMDDTQHLQLIPPPPGQENMPEYQAALAEQDFMRRYQAKWGVPWLGFYPRKPPRFPIWTATRPGQIHEVQSNYGFYNCEPSQAGCQMGPALDLTLQVVSTRPRVFAIDNVLSDWECDWIIEQGRNVISRSLVGEASSAFTSTTRTSQNGWLDRNSSAVLENIFNRMSDVVDLPEKELLFENNAEHLQVVRYLEGQHYTPHHDFGYTGHPEQRFLTLLLYLNEPKKGGGTSFPKAYGGRGFKVNPPKGSAVLFYSLMPDGNGDDLSLHSGMKVEEGEKWICNLWVWEPKK